MITFWNDHIHSTARRSGRTYRMLRAALAHVRSTDVPAIVVVHTFTRQAEKSLRELGATDEEMKRIRVITAAKFGDGSERGRDAMAFVDHFVYEIA